MTMKMLEAGGLLVVTDGLRAADASNPNGYYELEEVKTLSTESDGAWLAGARGKAVKVISFLLTYLPESYDYQVVFMRRDLGEIVASQNAMLDARGEPRGAGDERMRAHYEQHLEQVERFLARRSCFSTLMVNYTDVLGRAAGAGRAHQCVPGRSPRRRADGCRRRAVAVSQSSSGNFRRTTKNDLNADSRMTEFI